MVRRPPIFALFDGMTLCRFHLYVFSVSGRLSGGSASNQPVGKGGSAKERPSRAWGEGGGVGGRLDFVVFYEGLRLWEVHLYVFYVSGRFREGPTSNQPNTPGGFPS